jgi:hypothetical protein
VLRQPQSRHALHYREAEASPITEPVGRIELVMAWSPEREGEVQRAFPNPKSGYFPLADHSICAHRAIA